MCPARANPPKGCHFCTRRPRVMDMCREKEPPFKDYGDGHYVACFLYEIVGQYMTPWHSFWDAKFVSLADHCLLCC